MTNLNQPYTVGKWIAKAGKENLFIREWEAFALWTAKTQAGAGIGNLLQNRDRSQEFISFGSWDSYSSIKTWRESPEFKTFASKVRELCEDFQPLSLILVANSQG